MIGTLGTDIVFEVSDNKIFTIESMARDVAGKWATHNPIGTKPKLEFLNAELQTINVTIQLNASLGVKPRDMMDAIAKMVENGTAERLIIGNRPVGNNYFVIQSVSETWGTMYSGGELATANITLTLGEYV